MKNFSLFKVIGIYFLFIPLSFAQKKAYKYAFQDPSKSFEMRTEDLLKRLTLEEKVQLMIDVSKPIERLGIKSYNWWNEALHGVARSGLATVFPQPIGMAASFDEKAVFNVFSAVSDEARAKYNGYSSKNGSERYQGLTMWTPTINIFRDPRWGRGMETYGEDPYLMSILGVAVVKGLQGPKNGKYDKLYACAKHFAVHSGPEWNRHSFNAANIKERDLYETYLPAFEALVKDANVQQVMCAYNRFEGEPCCGNDQLLTQILRNKWGFKGIVVSDCGAIDDFYASYGHKSHANKVLASASAVRAGTDLECGSSYTGLIEGVKKGLIDEKAIDISVRRLLLARFRLGEMDQRADVSWNKIPYHVVGSKEHHALALEMARKSMTLLLNKNKILPLKRGKLKVAVVGPNAKDSVMQWGNYNGFPPYTVTLLEGVRKALGKNDELVYEQGTGLVENNTPTKNIIEKIKNVDVVIFAGGISPVLEGEEKNVNLPGFRGGDRTDIELPAVQRQFISELKKAGKKVILVNYSGSAIGLVPEVENCDAILQAWYPGQAGGTAVAEVLFGDYNPSGRLPVTFYKDVSQLPDFQDYNMTGRTYRYFEKEPLFHFGYGLSYSSFQFGKPRKDHQTISLGKKVQVVIPITNTSTCDGDEIVQIYLKKEDDKEGPQKELRAVQRVSIPAGKTKEVRITLSGKQLFWWDKGSSSVRAVPGKFELMVGSSSRNEDLQKIKLLIKN